MKDKLAKLKPKLLTIEKTIWFRAFTPLAFVVLLVLYIITTLRLQYLDKLFWDAVLSDIYLGTKTVDSLILENDNGAQYQLLSWLSPLTLVLLIVIGLVLTIWASWAVSNLAETKGFSKRQYFWLSIVIGPVIPWIIASASKPASPKEVLTQSESSTTLGQ